MTSSENEPSCKSRDQNCLSLRSHQLLERKKLLCVIQELRDHVEFGQGSKEVGTTQQEIDSTDDKLAQLSERKAEIQNSHDPILSADRDNDSAKSESKVLLQQIITASNFALLLLLLLEVSFSTASQKTAPLESNSTTIYYITPPPSTPAPIVILEAEDLPACPCRTQCPECRQYIVTETSKSISSVTWLVCFMTAMIGCVAGCCLIPFCMESFKSTTHRCPRCRTVINIVKKL
ncbi:lipopolysaccharide-induced tumor necrosis factor-alpha factor homolog isoform X1 [Platichthys flesus]|uniref:lipopolysaccharide-induced tumor necrosis factor-alpha factor homolog isoform X1 n=1 Tax=Platichthys flesus TaxID=8260 RepID=UPI002DBFC88B|nr:lipopolysaccharide-induced tumor necrosis factor-alpha factor homolog isoform X1 [Platichthys flesus]